MNGRFSPSQFRVDSVPVSFDDEVDDAVLTVRLLIGPIKSPLGIGFVFSKQQIDNTLAVEEPLSK